MLLNLFKPNYSVIDIVLINLFVAALYVKAVPALVIIAIFFIYSFELTEKFFPDKSESRDF